jgi:hypothetical protein
MSTPFPKALVTVAAGGGTFLVTGVLSDSDARWQWTASLLAVVMAWFVLCLVDLGRRLEQVDRHVAEVLSATEWVSQVGRLDGSVLRSDEVTRLVLGCTEVREQGGDIVQAFAEMELGRVANVMEGLGRGRADCPGENHEWLIDLTECVKLTIDAISTSVDREFWSSASAERYLAAQEKAIKRRGVEIRQLFVVRVPEEVTPELAELCESHRRWGIEARIAVRSLMRSNPQVHDFIIFDSELCYETAPDLHPTPGRTWLHAEPEHVAHRIAQFSGLWAEAERTQSGPDTLPAP